MGKAPCVSLRFSKGELPTPPQLRVPAWGQLCPPTGFRAASEAGEFATAVIQSTIQG